MSALARLLCRLGRHDPCGWLSDADVLVAVCRRCRRFVGGAL